MNRKAITLSEILLAAVIMVVALCALLLAFMTCAYLNESNRNVTRATQHAQYVLEEIKDTDFSIIKTGIESGSWDWDAAQISAQGLEALNNESINTQVSGTDLLQIIVTTNWDDRGGRSRNISLGTLIAEP